MITMGKRISYFVAFKLQVLHNAKANDNIATSQEFYARESSMYDFGGRKKKSCEKFHPKSADLVTWACMVSY